MQEIGMAVGETAKNLTRQSCVAYLFPSLLFSLKIKVEFFLRISLYEHKISEVFVLYRSEIITWCHRSSNLVILTWGHLIEPTLGHLIEPT